MQYKAVFLTPLKKISGISSVHTYMLVPDSLNALYRSKSHAEPIYSWSRLSWVQMHKIYMVVMSVVLI